MRINVNRASLLGTRAAILALVPALLAACLSRPPVEMRYFHPRVPEASPDTVEGGTVPLRLGYVTAAPYLREPMVWRLSETEVGFDEIHLWAAPPETLAEDALRGALVRERGFLLTDSAGATTLYVRVAAFEVDRAAKGVVVRLEATLERPVSASVTRAAFEARRPTGIDDPREVAQAMGAALGDAVAQTGEWLKRALPE